MISRDQNLIVNYTNGRAAPDPLNGVKVGDVVEGLVDGVEVIHHILAPSHHLLTSYCL
jgi:hypothetical protein